MKSTSLRIIFAIIIMNLFIIPVAEAKYQNFVCEDSPLDCPMDFSCMDGRTPIVWCDPKDCEGCMIRCAKECGDLTDCSFPGGSEEDIQSNCMTCCHDNVCSKYDENSDELDACRLSCNSKCKFYSEFCNIITLLQILSPGIGIILLSINGIRWITSDDEESRDSAKKGVIYVIIGLLIIMISLAVVNMIYFGEIIC